MKRPLTLSVLGILACGVLLNPSEAIAKKYFTQAVIFEVDSMYGTSGMSLDGSYGYSLEFQVLKGGKRMLQLVGGIGATYAPGIAVLDGITSIATLISGNLFIGGQAVFFPKRPTTPYAELGAILGLGQVQVTPTPVTFNATTLGMLYGFKAGFGFRFKLLKRMGVVVAAHYKFLRSPFIAGQENFQFDSFSFGGGITF